MTGRARSLGGTARGVGAGRRRAAVGRGILFGAALLGVAIVGSARAQIGWSVQTVALRDFRDAQAVANDLRALGLSAYTEFTMSRGLQFVRVRVGCAADRELAEAWAGVLAGSLVAEAVAVPLDAPPPSDVACVVADVGFRKPARWSLVSAADEVALFQVEVAGHTAYLRFDGRAWRMWQQIPPEPLAAPPSRVQAARVGGHDVVRVAGGDLLCPGRLLAAVGDAAIVEVGDAIVACRPAADPGTP